MLSLLCLLIAFVNSIAQRTKCTSDFDCSYNGKCVDKYCECSPQWTGEHCAQLNLLPTDKSSGYQYNIDNQKVSSWGGSVVYDNKTGIHHMYAAEISEFCGIDAWQPNSIVIHAQSEPNKPLGTYSRMEEIDDIFSHEPDAIKDPITGEYVVYYSHVYPPPTGPDDPCTNCSNGVTYFCNNSIIPNDPYIIYTYMTYSSNPSGPWSDGMNVPGIDTGIDSNLAGIIFPNHTFIGLFRGGGSTDGWLRMEATNWKKANTYKTHGKINLPDGYGAEDPYLWYDYNNNVIHSIWHGGGWDSPWGYHWFSTDNGYNWNGFDEKIHAYDNTVDFSDGSHITFERVERPHIIFDTDNITPIALTNGVVQAGSKEQFFPDYSYTLLRPINQN
eukprot:456516_1